jgi:hypothetical protein
MPGDLASELAWLRDRYPAWHIATVWATHAADPDARRLIAWQGLLIVSAWDAAELATKIEHEQGPGARPPPRDCTAP